VLQLFEIVLLLIYRYLLSVSVVFYNSHLFLLIGGFLFYHPFKEACLKKFSFLNKSDLT
jgi:hypothetical protein